MYLPVGIGCPDEYEEWGHLCLDFHRMPETWASAQNICKDQGASLAKIDDLETNDIIWDDMLDKTYEDIWIDLKKS